MTDEQAIAVISQVIEPVLALNLTRIDDLVAVVKAELDAKFGPEAEEAFRVETSASSSSVTVGPKNLYLAEKLLRPYLAKGLA